MRGNEPEGEMDVRGMSQRGIGHEEISLRGINIRGNGSEGESELRGKRLIVRGIG